MGWRFRRSRRVLPGVRMTMTKNGLGWSFGGRGMRINRSPLGRWSRTVTIPGTGLSNTTPVRLPPSTSATTSQGPSAAPPAPPTPPPATSQPWSDDPPRPTIRLKARKSPTGQS
jgi:hypothetical protein